ncbi:hypothetical protein [Streptomyces sp. NPDC048845]|uniref:hypothetical protein n=1 Tax=Streptomyces sp. NPDC048845 TaxID=3155390 RepID=UPI0034228246
MPWPDPAAAHRRMLEQGWRRTEDGGYTRAPVPETEESAGGQQPGTAQQEQGADAEGDITLRVLVRKNASFRDEDYFERVGHSWVAFYKDDKFQFSAGFYPKGGQINQEAPHRSVPGEVRMNYDDPSGATTDLSADRPPARARTARIRTASVIQKGVRVPCVRARSYGARRTERTVPGSPPSPPRSCPWTYRNANAPPPWRGRRPRG